MPSSLASIRLRSCRCSVYALMRLHDWLTSACSGLGLGLGLGVGVEAKVRVGGWDSGGIKDQG